MEREWWLITIAGYGDYGYYGTEKEAEEQRAFKAAWEGGAGKKEAIPAGHPKAIDAEKQTAQEFNRGVPLNEREIDSIGRAH